MQVSTLSAQLGLGSKLVDWYSDATSVPFGILLINLLLRTYARQPDSKNIGSTPSKIRIPEQEKHFKSWDTKHTKTLYSPNVPFVFLQVCKYFLSVLYKRFPLVSVWMHCEHAQMTPAKHKKTRFNFQCKDFKAVSGSKTNNLEANIGRSGVRKNLTAHKKSLLIPSLAICLDMEQFVLVPASVYKNKKNLITQAVTKQELPKHQAERNQIDSLKNEMNKKLFANADSLVDKIFCVVLVSSSQLRTL